MRATHGRPGLGGESLTQCLTQQISLGWFAACMAAAAWYNGQLIFKYHKTHIPGTQVVFFLYCE